MVDAGLDNAGLAYVFLSCIFFSQAPYCDCCYEPPEMCFQLLIFKNVMG